MQNGQNSMEFVHSECSKVKSFFFLSVSVNMQTSEHVTVKDFELLKVLGTGGKKHYSFITAWRIE